MSFGKVVTFACNVVITVGKVVSDTDKVVTQLDTIALSAE